MQSTEKAAPERSTAGEARVRLQTSAMDGLRGFACLHITIGHALLFSRDLPIADLYGGASVSMFFMLSGFIMTLAYAQKPLRPPRRGEAGMQDPAPEARVLNAWPFLKKRLARLAPLYYLTMFLAVWPWFEYTKLWVPAKLRTLWYVVGAVTGLTWTHAWVLPVAVPNLELWSMSTMLFFYLVFPALAPRLQRVHRRNMRLLARGLYAFQLFAMMGFFAATNPFHDVLSLWIARAFPPLRLPLFAMGCCGAYCALDAVKASQDAANAAAQTADTRRSRSWVADLMCVVTLVLLATFVYVGSLDVEQLGYLPWKTTVRLACEALGPVLYFELMVRLCFEQTLGIGGLAIRILSSRPFTFLGEMSMSLYMSHAVLFRIFGLVVNERPSYDVWEAGTPSQEELDAYADRYFMMPPWGCLAVLPFCFLVAWALMRFVEQPCTRLLREGSSAPPVPPVSPAKPEAVGAATRVKKDSDSNGGSKHCVDPKMVHQADVEEPTAPAEQEIVRV